MAQKITITPDEVNSSEVDAKLRDHAALNEEPATPSDGLLWSKILHNPMIYMALFGLAGALLAWVMGEMVFLALPDHSDDYGYMLYLEEQINERAANGDITYEEADEQIEELNQQYADNAYIKIYADESLTGQQAADMIIDQGNRDAVYGLLAAFYFLSVIGIVVGFFLSIGDPAMGQNLRGVLVNGSIGISLGFVGSLVGFILVGFFLSLVVLPMLGEDRGFLGQVIFRTIAWAMLGTFMAVAPGVALKSWKRFLIGVAGGAIGGAIGGLLFDLIVAGTDSAVGSRFFAVMAIGVVSGLGTGLLENAAKTGWLRVIQGLIAGKQFILYKDTTYIGSSPQCEIYLFKDPSISPRHAAIHKRAGRHEIEDLRSETGTFVNGSPVSRAQLKKGEQIRIGTTVMVFLEKARESK